MSGRGTCHLTIGTWALAVLVDLEDQHGRPIRPVEIADETFYDAAEISRALRLMIGTYVERVERKRRAKHGYKPQALGYRSTQQGRTALIVFRRELRRFTEQGRDAQEGRNK